MNNGEEMDGIQERAIEELVGKVRGLPIQELRTMLNEVERKIAMNIRGSDRVSPPEVRKAIYEMELIRRGVRL
jgi:hypothetical protein